MSFAWCEVCQEPMRGFSDPAHSHVNGGTHKDLPCAACPSPIIPGAPRVERIRPGTQFYAEFMHPGCWAAEQRRQPGAHKALNPNFSMDALQWKQAKP